MAKETLPAKPETGTLTATSPPPIPGGLITSSQFLEYVASTPDSASIALDRALSRNIDDIERDFGLKIYDDMANDSTVAAAIRALKILVLADPFKVSACFEKSDVESGKVSQADFDKATEVAEFVGRCVESLEHRDRPFRQTLWDMLDCVKYGHRFAEVTYDTEDTGVDKGKTVLARIAPKPRPNYCFLTDPYNKLLGIMAIVPGVSPLIFQGLIPDPSKFGNAIAKEKCFLMRVGGMNDDPRGESLLRAAYDPWFRKKIGKTYDVKTAAQFGGGMIFAELGPDTAATEPNSGKPMAQYVSDLIAAGAGSGGVVTTPAGVTVTVDRPSGDGSYFDAYFERCDRAIVMSVLVSSRTLLEAKHSSKADGSQSQDLLDEIKAWLQGLVCDSVKNSLFFNLVAVNEGPDVARRFTPRLVMKSTARPDFGVNVTALATIGYKLSPSQFGKVDDEFGFGERSEDDLKQLADEQAMALQPKAAPGQDPNAPAAKPQRKVAFDRGGKFDDRKKTA